METIQWTADRRKLFYKDQGDLTAAHTISLPIPSDQLWVVKDGALRKPGICATPNDKLRLPGFF